MDTHDAKNVADGAAVAIGVSNFMQWFPPVVGLVTGLLTVVWFVIRIYETNTVQKLVHGKKDDDASNKS
ncbi:MAG: hypothetical protein RL541_1297 [Pseudomonadota bacterium]|jgi:hypothetical protein